LIHSAVACKWVTTSQVQVQTAQTTSAWSKPKFTLSVVLSDTGKHVVYLERCAFWFSYIDCLRQQTHCLSLNTVSSIFHTAWYSFCNLFIYSEIDDKAGQAWGYHLINLSLLRCCPVCVLSEFLSLHFNSSHKLNWTIWSPQKKVLFSVWLNWAQPSLFCCGTV